VTYSLTISQLHARRARCRAALASLEPAYRHLQNCCNICGSGRSALLATNDRYGFSVRTVLCLDCGLIYLQDPLSLKDYAQFYGSGAYRDLTDAFNGDTATMEAIQTDQRNYARGVARLLQSVPDFARQGTLLDIGGSAGAVAVAVAAHFNYEITVLDPAAEEVAAARAIGAEGIVGTLETFESSKKFDIILLCRSIEHLFDLKCSLQKIRDSLNPNGIFYCDLIDFVESCQQTGGIEANSKIDHCYWLCQQTAADIFGSVGLEIVGMDLTSPVSIGYLLQSCEPQPLPPIPHASGQIARQLRAIDNDWRQSVQGRRTLLEQLRWLAYRGKRKVMRQFATGAPMNPPHPSPH
jgi:SAM-dependent methyltransferase